MRKYGQCPHLASLLLGEKSEILLMFQTSVIKNGFYSQGLQKDLEDRRTDSFQHLIDLFPLLVAFSSATYKG